VEAQLDLYIAYSNGEGVAQDNAEAAKWWQRAAENGDSEAQYKLGLLYYDGKGVPQDFVLAHMWLNIASASSYATAEEDRERVASQMTSAQISEAQRLAQEKVQKIYPGLVLKEVPVKNRK
jgi:TPR repeat protein